MSVQMLGVTVNPLTIGALNALVGRCIQRGGCTVIANHNMNSVNLIRTNELMQEFYSAADYVHIDGMPLIWAGRVLGHPLDRSHRVTYVDWIGPLMAEAAARGWRVYYLGSRQGVAERGAAVLRGRFPGLQIATSHGYFDVTPGSSDNEVQLAQIQEYAPNILMVGMGMPRQEQWILQNRDRLAANVVLPAGACLDYLAGELPTPPRWMGRVGLEWFFRLCAEPKRLGRRYIIEPWPVMALLLREWMGRRTVSRGRMP